MIKANGRKWYVIDVIKGKPLWVTEATNEDLKEINVRCEPDWKVRCKWNKEAEG